MILNIYKEKDWTSFDVVAKIRGLLGGKRKVGHAGTLDPLAEGVLIVLTDEDTKRQSEFMKMRKVYLAEIGFGITTPTYDLEYPPDVSEKQMGIEKTDTVLRKELPKYIGKINQKVPPYSAVKVEGKRLYKQARKGKIDEDKIPVKEVEIYRIKILESLVVSIETKLGRKTFPVFRMEIECSSGTYVRSLAHNLGEDLGVGAVLVNLIRTKVGDFDAKDSKKISDLQL